MFPNLRAEMVRNGVKATDIARAIHKSWQTTRCKLNGCNDFTLSEVQSIRDELFPGMTLDELFERELEGEKKKPA